MLGMSAGIEEVRRVRAVCAEHGEAAWAMMSGRAEQTGASA